MLIVEISASVLAERKRLRERTIADTKRKFCAREKEGSIEWLMPDGKVDGRIQSTNEWNEKKPRRNSRINGVARLVPVVLFGIKQKFSDQTTRAVGTDDDVGS